MGEGYIQHVDHQSAGLQAEGCKKRRTQTGTNLKTQFTYQSSSLQIRADFKCENNSLILHVLLFIPDFYPQWLGYNKIFKLAAPIRPLWLIRRLHHTYK